MKVLARKQVFIDMKKCSEHKTITCTTTSYTPLKSNEKNRTPSMEESVCVCVYWSVKSTREGNNTNLLLNLAQKYNSFTSES
eukprot:m.141361 g.141361  ORF g.141361 m.141361 type:complete len:82 (-) comp13194_c6_seq1:1165-1410(-)